MKNKRINELNDEQKTLMKTIRDEWVSLLDSCQRPNKAELISGIDWLYALAGLEKPWIIFVKSPLGAQYCANLIKKICTSKKIKTKPVLSAVDSEVYSEVLSAVGSAVRSAVEKLEWFPMWSYGGIGSYGWVSFYDYFERIGFKYINQESFIKFKTLTRAGGYDIIQLKGVCIVIEMPTELHREAPLNGRLHCTTGPSIKFGDGYELYHLWGVRFEKDLFEKVTHKKLTPQEIITIPNIEHRMCAMKFYGDELDIPEDSCKLLKEEGGYKLFSIQLNPEIKEKDYFLKYSCPSTGRKYLSFVDPNVGKKGDPIECIASKFKLSKEQWMSIEQHT